MKKVLLCPPAFYDIEYEINPWMNVKNKVDRKKVMEEYAELKNTYRSLGVEVLEIDPVKGLPDMVYVANTGFPLENKFILANFRFPQRRKEADYAKKLFEKQGFEIVKIPGEFYFEGQGDLLTAGEKFFLGWGKRSSRGVKDILNEKLGIEFIDLELRDPYFYHLNMSLGPLNSETALVNLRSFTKEGLAKLKKEFPNIIEISEADNKFMACNLVVVGKTVVIAKGISNKLKDDIREHGFDVAEVSTGEYRKGGGSVKCLTLEFF